MDKIIFYWLKTGLMEYFQGSGPYNMDSKKKHYCFKSKEIVNKIKYGVRVNPKKFKEV